MVCECTVKSSKDTDMYVHVRRRVTFVNVYRCNNNNNNSNTAGIGDVCVLHRCGVPTGNERRWSSSNAAITLLLISRSHRIVADARAFNLF